MLFGRDADASLKEATGWHAREVKDGVLDQDYITLSFSRAARPFPSTPARMAEAGGDSMGRQEVELVIGALIVALSSYIARLLPRQSRR